MLKIKVDFLGDCISAEISSDNQDFQYQDYEYAFYLFKDNIRVQAKWYASTSSVRFDLKDTEGNYHVRGFIRESKESKPVIIDSREFNYAKKSDTKKKILILTRYSILSYDSATSWKIGQNDKNEYRDKLFNENRLDLHENLFFNLTLCSIEKAINNTDIDVSLILFISTELPSSYKERLYEAASEKDFFHIRELSPYDKTLESMSNSAVECLSVDNDDVVYATVRLDDDDALHPQFFRFLGAYLEPAFSGTCISFSKGLSGLFDGNKFTSFHNMNSINNAQGLATVSYKFSSGEVSGLKSIYSTGISHTRTHWKFPVIVDGSNIMYIRTVHTHGDYYSDDYAKRVSKGKIESKESVSTEFFLNPELI